MQSNEKIIELNKKLPHGTRKKIADKTGLSLNTVAKYFRGVTVGFDTEALILKETKVFIDKIENLEEQKRELFNCIK